ncbi:DUF362 domain-containing protein [Candidatus Woesearchaeota archaeon]|nr:DUF362 domain-containing protein [Candidatus Woesearchaeota archaeon]
MAEVSLVKGVVRYDNVFRALELIQGSVADKISKSSSIVIKPDLLHVRGCSPSANVDSVKAVLDFIDEFTNKKIAIAEGSFTDEDVFHNHGFHDLLNDYSVRFVDLNKDDSVPVKLGSRAYSVSKSLLRADFRISVGLPRTYSSSFLGCVSNMVLGAVQEKSALLKSRHFSKNVLELYKLLRPNLAVLDGFDTVTSKKEAFAVASADAMAADKAAAKFLGIKANYATARAKIKILGESLS